MDHPSEREWASIAEHTRASNFAGGLLRMPPYPLILTLRTLVGSADVVTASHALFQWEPETRWQVWLFTADALAYAEASYSETSYDYDEDNERRTKPDPFDKPIDAESLIAWLRPVSAVSCLTIDAVRYARRSHPFREPPPEFYPTSLGLAFSDGTSIRIEVKSPLDEAEKLERWEKFCKAARCVVAR
ncbi:hypothetical protein KN248_022105 [Mycobacterium paraintracellulare]|uniref:hypothetical protein n=1 Tax=Mycobacterium paraintracellulare TaxID=1138383 RepID=UPI001925BBE3|nr:hypothetical protein [Mycobacterium paraintracellulare]WVL51133.1 hypothetical protein KN248_022105 [Mycobacterium paraintracellulare]BCO38935.1 hypothetical protein MINTM001_00740 [Mycobacterium paraintracellulare]